MNYNTLFMHNQILVALAVLWTIPWKGYALWKAARRNQPWWFVALLVTNTLSFLEILYIFIFSEMKMKKMQRNSQEQGAMKI